MIFVANKRAFARKDGRSAREPLRAFGFFYRKKKEKDKRQIIQTEKSNF